MKPTNEEAKESGTELQRMLYEELRDRKDLTEVEEWTKQEPNRWLVALSMEMSCLIDVGHGAYELCPVTRKEAKDCDDSNCDSGMLCAHYKNPLDCTGPCLEILMEKSNCQRFLKT